MKNLPLILLICTAAFGCRQTAENAPPQVNAESSAPIINTETPSATRSISLAQFNQLKTGMRYAEAVKILGAEGVVMSQSEFSKTTTIVYGWDVGFGQQMTALFQNDKLISKSQVGLK